jgi:hypothetical protein
MPGPAKYFWDSCVFRAYLSDERNDYDVDSLIQFLEEAQDKKIQIYCSTLSVVEILPSHMKIGFPSFEAFLSDFHGVIVSIDPNPLITSLAARLRDLPYRKGASAGRRLGTPDAIILATAIHLEQAYQIKLDAFHTYDKGKGKGDFDDADDRIKKPVPIIGYETWCDGFDVAHQATSSLVTNLNRCPPIHSSPKLLTPPRDASDDASP